MAELSEEAISKLLIEYDSWVIVFYQTEVKISKEIYDFPPRYQYNDFHDSALDKGEYWLVEKKKWKKKKCNRNDNLFLWQLQEKHDGSYDSLAKLINKYELLDYRVINKYSYNLFMADNNDVIPENGIIFDIYTNLHYIKNKIDLKTNFIRPQHKIDIDKYGKLTPKDIKYKIKIQSEIITKSFYLPNLGTRSKPCYDTIGGNILFSELEKGTIIGKIRATVRYFISYLHLLHDIKYYEIYHSKIYDPDSAIIPERKVFDLKYTCMICSFHIKIKIINPDKEYTYNICMFLNIYRLSFFYCDD